MNGGSNEVVHLGIFEFLKPFVIAVLTSSSFASIFSLIFLSSFFSIFYFGFTDHVWESFLESNLTFFHEEFEIFLPKHFSHQSHFFKHRKIHVQQLSVYLFSFLFFFHHFFSPWRSSEKVESVKIEIAFKLFCFNSESWSCQWSWFQLSRVPGVKIVSDEEDWRPRKFIPISASGGSGRAR